MLTGQWLVIIIIIIIIIIIFIIIITQHARFCVNNIIFNYSMNIAM